MSTCVPFRQVVATVGQDMYMWLQPVIEEVTATWAAARSPRPNASATTYVTDQGDLFAYEKTYVILLGEALGRGH